MQGFDDFSRYWIKKNSEESLFISIIIPVFNRAEKINQCLSRLNESSYGKENFEVIIIDDFSNDDTLKVVKKFIPLFPNIIVVSRKFNSGGASVPRNNGISLSSGKYLFFLDSDDYITSFSLSEAVALIDDKFNIDMVCMPFFRSKNSTRKISQSAFSSEINVKSVKFKDTKLYNSLNAVGKLIKSDLVKINKIEFPENIRVREDNFFMMKVYSVVDNIAILGNLKEYYFTSEVDAVSLSRNGTPPRDAVNIYLSTYYFIMKNDLIEFHEKIDLLAIFMNRYYLLIKRGDCAPIKLFKNIENNLIDLLKNDYLSLEAKDFLKNLISRNNF